MAYQVQFTAEAVAMVNNIADRRIQRQVLQCAESLAEEPEKTGEAAFRKVILIQVIARCWTALSHYLLDRD